MRQMINKSGINYGIKELPASASVKNNKVRLKLIGVGAGMMMFTSFPSIPSVSASNFNSGHKKIKTDSNGTFKEALNNDNLKVKVQPFITEGHFSYTKPAHSSSPLEGKVMADNKYQFSRLSNIKAEPLSSFNMDEIKFEDREADYDYSKVEVVKTSKIKAKPLDEFEI